MMEDPDVIDSGGSPSMDLQDEDLMEKNNMTKEMGLDHNDPKEVHPMNSEEHILEAKGDEEDQMLMKRKARIGKMMGR